MSGYSTKIYIVQKADGEVVGAKTAFTPAHILARKHAPAKVLFSVADKTDKENVVGHASNQTNCS